MNNKGQTLVALIVMFPIIIIVISIVIELSSLAYERHRFISTSKTILDNIFETNKNLDSNLKDDIIKLYDENNITIDNIVVENNESIKIIASEKVPSIMGKIIKKDYYDIKINIVGYLEDNKVKFIKG